MDWKDIATLIRDDAPALSGILAATGVGAPVAAAIAAAGSLAGAALGVPGTPDDVGKALQVNPDAAVKLRQLETDEAKTLATLAAQTRVAEITADSDAVKATNTTMQAEAAADHWPTYSWRPFIGFAVGANIILSTCMVVGVFVAMCLNAAGADKAVAALPGALGALAALVALASPILGIASWYRGKAQADPRIQTDNRG